MQPITTYVCLGLGLLGLGVGLLQKVLDHILQAGDVDVLADIPESGNGCEVSRPRRHAQERALLREPPPISMLLRAPYL